MLELHNHCDDARSSLWSLAVLVSWTRYSFLSNLIDFFFPQEYNTTRVPGDLE